MYYHCIIIVFDIQNLVLTRELIKFIDYKIMLIYSVKLHLILQLLVKKNHQN